jgi:hypothetical protein
MRLDDEGWLVAEEGDPAVARYPTVRRSPLVVPAPLGIVWHWTAGRGGPGFAEALARRARTYRRGIDRAASWHVLIAKDGGIHQSAPFTVGTWHVGRPGVIAGRPLWKRERLPGVLDHIFGGGSVASVAPAPCAAQGG